MPDTRERLPSRKKPRPDEDVLNGNEQARALHAGLIQEGGLLTSLYDTKQQWDAPNAWPPLQYFAVEGLRQYGGMFSGFIEQTS